jgi:AcrR family transcriptional regulator
VPSRSPEDDKLERLPRGRHGLSREAVASSQRERILRAMVDVVAERGYPETRVVDVIKRAGVSRKTFYEFFGDREECFLAAYDQALGELYRGTELAYESASGKPWAERIRAALETFLGRMAAEPERAKFCIVDVLSAGPRALARRDAAIRQFAGIIDAGRAESELDLPAITALSIAGGINELIYSELLRGAGAQLPQRLPEIIYWLTQPFLGTDAAETERQRAIALRRSDGAGSA